ncbi:MAG: FtsX-like permease family protein, partial [Candidatus Omnitrophica bacterium]|nr:FtsX-like permease family protein [Candidatus Omnitrophota bacterium]
YMFINVRERRREIGTLLAIGATPKIILKVFLQKAILLGLIGGFTGYIFGVFLAICLGPKIVKVPVSPTLGWCLWAVVIAVIFSVVSSVIPAKRAANLDAAEILQEE